MVKAT
jgi:hypothetical protein